jgi:hypothetical protein
MTPEVGTIPEQPALIPANIAANSHKHSLLPLNFFSTASSCAEQEGAPACKEQGTILAYVARPDRTQSLMGQGERILILQL